MAFHPLAYRMRPQNLDEIVGQQHLVGPGKTAVNAEQEALLARMGTLQERLEYFDVYEGNRFALQKSS